MSAAEIAVLEQALAGARRVLEYGAGGSTVMALAHVRAGVVAVDSSRAWLDKVAAAAGPDAAKLRSLHVDIGPLGKWGKPADLSPASQARFPAYHQRVWSEIADCDYDLFLIDGRFRVACLATIVLNARRPWRALVHDYPERRHYHGMERIAQRTGLVETLATFEPAAGDVDAEARALLAHHAVDWR